MTINYKFVFFFLFDLLTEQDLTDIINCPESSCDAKLNANFWVKDIVFITENVKPTFIC